MPDKPASPLRDPVTTIGTAQGWSTMVDIGAIGSPGEVLITSFGGSAYTATESEPSTTQGSDAASEPMWHDIDLALARLEQGIGSERAAMSALLDRLAVKAA